MESILEELASKYDIDLEQEIMNFKYEKQDEMHHRKMDFFISTVGDVLTKNE
jgi:hypothetical protein